MKTCFQIAEREFFMENRHYFAIKRTCGRLFIEKNEYISGRENV